MKTLTKVLMGAAFLTTILGTVKAMDETKKDNTIKGLITSMTYITGGMAAGFGLLYSAKKYEGKNKTYEVNK